MLNKLKELLFNNLPGGSSKGGSTKSGTPQKGKTAVPEDIDKKARIAICALLIETANFDGDFHEDEKKMIIDLVKGKFDLSEEEANELIAISDAERKESIDLWQFTKLLNEHYDKKGRVHLLEMLWKVVYADGRLHGHEDFLIHKFAKLLKLQHKDLIDAKINVKSGAGGANSGQTDSA